MRLQDLEIGPTAGEGLAVGGDVAVLPYDGTNWCTDETPTAENLTAVILETDALPATAVGAGGVILRK